MLLTCSASMAAAGATVRPTDSLTKVHSALPLLFFVLELLLSSPVPLHVVRTLGYRVACACIPPPSCQAILDSNIVGTPFRP